MIEETSDFGLSIRSSPLLLIQPQPREPFGLIGKLPWS